MVSTETKEDDDTKFQYYNELIYFLKVFADKCHHGKEENFLFEELIKKGVPKKGGPVGVMLQEHKQSREYITLMDKSLESKDLAELNNAAAKYRNLLMSHIEKENNVLFVMADQLLDETRQEKLYQDFAQHEENVIGHGVHEELHSMIHRWSEKFKV